MTSSGVPTRTLAAAETICVRVEIYGGQVVVDAVEVTAVPPAGYGPEVMIRFFPEYSARHPLWFWFDQPDLDALQLPADLAGRLLRWSAYWDSTFHWDHGWPVGTPARWWMDEEARLPRDLAIALGSDFVIEADGHHVHSTRDADSPASAAAVHALIDVETAERQRIRARLETGEQYDAVAGAISYRTWLAHRGRSPDR